MHEIDISHYVAPEDQQNLLNQSVSIDPNDPFDDELVARALAKLDTPIQTYSNYVAVNGPMPEVKEEDYTKLGKGKHYGLEIICK